MIYIFNIKNSPLIKYEVVFCVVVFCFLVFIPQAFAIHAGSPSSGSYSVPTPGETLCERGDALIDRGTPGGLSIRGWADGLFVPVKDFEAEAYLRAIAGDINAIEKDTNLIERDTQVIRYYLKQLCFKELSYDHTIQHAWAKVIGEFVKKTKEFVLTAYDLNPIFVTTPNTYYRTVDFAVLSALLQDIKYSNIGEKARELIYGELLKRQFEDVFPYDENKKFEQWAPDDLPNLLADNNPNNAALMEDYWLEYRNFQYRPTQSVSSLVALAEAEYESRRQKIRAIEEQKLNWGRGFLSYESCDLELYKVDGTRNRWDRRNCRIITPGSLIQDSVSLIFGSAIRQMEAADEFEEWVAGNTIALLNDVLNLNGLQRSRPGVSTNPISPQQATPLIIPGERPALQPRELELFNLEKNQPNRLLDKLTI